MKYKEIILLKFSSKPTNYCNPATLLGLLSHPSDLQPSSFEQIILLQLSSLPSFSYRWQQKTALNNYKPDPRQTITMQAQIVCGIEGSLLGGTAVYHYHPTRSKYLLCG